MAALAVLTGQLDPVLGPLLTPIAPSQTLASYVLLQTGGTLSSDKLAVLLGYNPGLFSSVDQRRQALPATAAERIAEYLTGRYRRTPLAEVVWAAGGRLLAAPMLAYRMRTR